MELQIRDKECISGSHFPDLLSEFSGKKTFLYQFEFH